MHPEEITESEIHAYFDGELDIRRRLAVEQHLARNADAAARFMADLELRTSLRIIAGAGAGAEPPASMIDAASRLTNRLAARPIHRLGGIFGSVSAKLLAAAALLAVILIPGRNVVQASPPDFVGDAVDAYHTSVLRAGMVSQVETPGFDAQEVERSVRIRMPQLPERWMITDAQIYPTDEGPALQLMIDTPAGEKMSIFAVRAPSKAPAQPIAVRRDGVSVAYWQDGEMSYALTGTGEPDAVDLAAEDIARIS